MDVNVKKLWVNALKSGKYEQGSGRLASVHDDGNMFCCLGVLCDIAVKQGVVPKPTVRDDDSSKYKVLSYEDELNFLPPTVAEWAGLDARPLLVTRDWETGELCHEEITEMNDSLGYSFHDLAALIDTQF